jgi:hypothetical protein
VIPVIAPAEAAATQSTPEPVDARTCPLVPGSLSLSKREPRSLIPPFTSKLVVGVMVPIPTLSFAASYTKLVAPADTLLLLKIT